MASHQAAIEQTEQKPRQTVQDSKNAAKLQAISWCQFAVLTYLEQDPNNLVSAFNSAIQEMANKYTVTLRYNAVVRRHLLGPPYKRGALWDPVDLFDIIIPRRSKGHAKLPRLEVEVELV